MFRDMWLEQLITLATKVGIVKSQRCVGMSNSGFELIFLWTGETHQISQSHVDITEQHRSTFEASLPLLKAWMKDNPDADLVKRAETICCRFE